jgi:post-segregation antitoxin (ccd killing protein)
MRRPPYDTRATKQTVSLTINSDLYGQAKSFGINASQVAEEALAYQVAQRKAEIIREEIRKDLAACSAYETEHGSFAELVREHYGASGENDEAV